MENAPYPGSFQRLSVLTLLHQILLCTHCAGRLHGIPEYRKAVEELGPSKPTQTRIAPANADPLPGYQGNAADLPTLQTPYFPTTARKEPLGREVAYKPEPLPLPGLQGRTTDANNCKCCNFSLFRDYSKRVRLKEKTTDIRMPLFRSTLLRIWMRCIPLTLQEHV